MNMQKYDYMILGMGASGLMLAYHMASTRTFDKKQILLIDKDFKNKNDRTWCFWEKNEGDWEAILTKKWSAIYFGSTTFSKKMSISPYQYKMIRSKDFYNYIFTFLEKKSNITLVREEVISLTDIKNTVEVKTNDQVYYSSKVFTSILQSNHKNQTQYPVLNQHFVGWYIKSDTAIFDAETATFMDFSVDQKANTRFMYVLPISETEALFEYTLFSEHLLEQAQYEEEIVKYLQQKGITAYNIIEKEKGCIPMTCYPFYKHNTSNILHIGTAGGWTKPSTGFTFNFISKKTKKLVAFLEKETDLSKFKTKNRFWYYDLLFIDVLYQRNDIGASLFSRFFKRNKVTKILKFLDEETTYIEDIKLTTSLPIRKFLYALWKRI